jgi:hypothetical protein
MTAKIQNIFGKCPLQNIPNMENFSNEEAMRSLNQIFIYEQDLSQPLKMFGLDINFTDDLHPCVYKNKVSNELAKFLGDFFMVHQLKISAAKRKSLKDPCFIFTASVQDYNQETDQITYNEFYPRLTRKELNEIKEECKRLILMVKHQKFKWFMVSIDQNRNLVEVIDFEPRDTHRKAFQYKSDLIEAIIESTLRLKQDSFDFEEAYIDFEQNKDPSNDFGLKCLYVTYMMSTYDVRSSEIQLD